MDNQKLDLGEGRKLRDRGAALVTDNQAEDWRARYEHLVWRCFTEMPKAQVFTGEALRVYALSHGLEQPTHPAAWSALAGATLRRWLREGRIVMAGMQQAQDPRAHARRYPAYKKISQ